MVTYRRVQGGTPPNASRTRINIDENENAIPQKEYKSNALNQGGTAPKIVDPTTPGNSYELPALWIEWIEEYAKNGRITK